MASSSAPLKDHSEVPVPSRPAGPADDAEFERIRAAIRGIRFGEVRIILQDGIVIQIDRLEKQRIR
jgi:hypothetical protein